MLEKRYGARRFAEYLARRETALAGAAAWDEACCRGPLQPLYHCGDDLIDETRIEINSTRLRLPGVANSVALDLPNRYPDMV
jgi:acetoacetyl-[acyl-carrier protein] synthase